MRKSTKILIVLLLIVAVGMIAGYFFSKSQTQKVLDYPTKVLSIHFLDVGQADCILVVAPNGHTMLVDAGNNGDADYIIDYLQRHHIAKIDVLVGTHPHEDHIGAMDAVIQTIEIGQVYLPKVAANTKTFQDVLLAIKQKGLRVNTAKAGVSIPLDQNVTTQILAPLRENYDDTNNYSAVIRLTYQKTGILLMGDAETEVENEILHQGLDIKVDLLKVGHHGSNSSTSADFLQEVSPTYAVISVGAGNRYGHPHQATLERLLDRCVVKRTDLDGDIVFQTDGKKFFLDR